MSHIDLTVTDAGRSVPFYDAVFFADPDGLKLECVHLPAENT